MTNSAIKVEGISKLYRLEHAATRSATFRDALTRMASAPLRRFQRLSGSDATLEDFWALQDVSFDVMPGEVVGIIGRNGAGKSTLLKVLSRIVEPTRGQATMWGRVASLLEVGTGFHPELTGRENIYLNGSILGMRKREIDAQFDAVVDFSEIERFLDTPVKRYSSGMYVRLAFAVAAHLNPEILIVDEVLAVGDAEFQKKCLGKMQEVSAGGGRTVLFVSHNMAAVRGLCSRGIWLKSGRVAMDDTAENVVQAYLEGIAGTASASVEFVRPIEASIWMRHAELRFDGVPATAASMGADISIAADFETDIPIRHPRFGYVLQTLEGEKLFNSNNRYQPSPEFAQPVSRGSIVCRLGAPPLMPGRYVVSLWIGDLSSNQHVELESMTFEILEKDLWGFGQIPPRATPMWWPTTYEFQEASK